jgi:hypothetical protein
VGEAGDQQGDVLQAQGRIGGSVDLHRELIEVLERYQKETGRRVESASIMWGWTHDTPQIAYVREAHISENSRHGS